MINYMTTTGHWVVAKNNATAIHTWTFPVAYTAIYGAFCNLIGSLGRVVNISINSSAMRAVNTMANYSTTITAIYALAIGKA